MRAALIDWLVERASERQDICLLTADLGYSVIEPFSEAFPDQFVNVGVAEQNMVGIASGLALNGFLPYTYSIGIFPTFRCAEQLRNDIDYHQLPVVTCTVGSGVAYGNLGYSHHAIQDLTLMRSLPNTLIATPSDPLQVRQVLDWHLENPCPMYLRLHKAGEESLNVYPCNVNPGSLCQIWPPSVTSNSKRCDSCVLVVGHLAADVLRICASQASHIPVFTVPLWGQSAIDELVNSVRQYTSVITVEDHILSGGFGSYVMEGLAAAYAQTRVIPFALCSDVLGKVAKESELLRPLLSALEQYLREYGLSSDT